MVIKSYPKIRSPAGIDIEFYNANGSMVAWFPFKGWGSSEKTRFNAEMFKKDNPGLEVRFYNYGKMNWNLLYFYKKFNIMINVDDSGLTARVDKRTNK